MKLYAFDIDHTIEISQGPVTLASMMELRNQGNIVGLCGNWGAFTQLVSGWHHLISFMNVSIDKETCLNQIKMFVPADEYILVGNIFGVTGGSDDKGAAERTGWRFILERDFAAGAR